MKIDSLLTSILREIDVDLTSICWRKHIVYKINNSGNLRARRSQLKTDLSINVRSWLSFLKHVSSLMVGAFICYSMLTTLPYIFKQNKYNQGC